MAEDKEIPQWEIDLRAQLDKELPDGSYIITTGGFSVHTGKQGEIEFRVAIHRAAMDWKFEEPTETEKVQIADLKNMSEKDIEDMVDKGLKDFDL